MISLSFLPSARDVSTSLSLPLLFQKIPAGFPSPASDFSEGTLDANAYLIRHPAASFYFSVAGDSMRGAGIFDGDKILVDRAVEPVHGHIVVAAINGEYTLKRLYRQRGVLELRAENSSYAPIRIKEGEELLIWGVVVGVIRRYAV